MIKAKAIKKIPKGLNGKVVVLRELIDRRYGNISVMPWSDREIEVITSGEGVKTDIEADAVLYASFTNNAWYVNHVDDGNPICFECRHWLYRCGRQDGECRRSPPQILYPSDSVWPITKLFDCCGEYEKRK